MTSNPSSNTNPLLVRNIASSHLTSLTDSAINKTIATLTFSGIEKTSRFDQGEPFSESWRMERAQGDNQPWLIAGMRQN